MANILFRLMSLIFLFGSCFFSYTSYIKAVQNSPGSVIGALFFFYFQIPYLASITLLTIALFIWQKKVFKKALEHLITVVLITTIYVVITLYLVNQ